MVETEKIAALLEAEGLKAEWVNNRRGWRLRFRVGESESDETVFLYPSAGEDKDYLFCFSLIPSAPLDSMPAATLRALIREASTGTLARMEYSESEKRHYFVSTSEC